MIVICNIFCSKRTDYDILTEYLKTYPVRIATEFIQDDKPTLIVGWEFVKTQFKDQNILDKKIDERTHWTYSMDEDKNQFLRHTKKFVEKSLLNWIPKNFILYDPFFNGDIKVFLEQNLNNEKQTFIFFNKQALYLNNDNKNFIVNIKSLLHFNLINKEELTQILNQENSVIFSYNNAVELISLDGFKGTTLDSLFWVKYSVEVDEEGLFNIIPNFDYKKYIPFFMNIITPREPLSLEERVFLERMKTRDLATWISSSNDICVEKDIDLASNKEITQRGDKAFVKINYSNKRTKTNRIVCKDLWNIQNEPKDSPRRKKIVSRFEGGRIFVCDYNSFETRISMFLTKNKEFIQEYKDKDLHIEVAKEIFIKDDEISTKQRETSKFINHALLYGASHNRLKEILSNLVEEDEKEERLYFVKKMLEPIIKNSKAINEECNKNGYIKTPWGSIVWPDKEYAAYNNLVQTIASEIIVDKILEINELLKDKESKFLFSIHDSMVFDISPKEKGLATEILKIMSSFNKSKFWVDYRFGKNYLNLSEKKTFA